MVTLEMTHEGKKDWKFFREKAQNMMWPHIDASIARNCKASPRAL